MKQNNEANEVWRGLVEQLATDPEYVSRPRGMQVSELLNAHYSVAMPAYLDIAERNVNVAFMFAEAAWILSGRNDLAYIKEYLPGYAKFSDDGQFMRGAYGPKVVDQLPYIVETLKNDNDSRQAVLTIWRERPGSSKDIPCTVAMQFLLREDELHLITTMRSNDVVLGLTFDIFTFSMVALAVKLLLKEQGIKNVELGKLHVNAGSLHLYDDYYERAEKWATSKTRDGSIETQVGNILLAETYTDLVNRLIRGAHHAKKTI